VASPATVRRWSTSKPRSRERQDFQEAPRCSTCGPPQPSPSASTTTRDREGLPEKFADDCQAADQQGRPLVPALKRRLGDARPPRRRLAFRDSPLTAAASRTGACRAVGRSRTGPRPSPLIYICRGAWRGGELDVTQSPPPAEGERGNGRPLETEWRSRDSAATRSSIARI
jgi:hypothetical protein